MITISGGKWTTYRRMAEDCVNQAATLARLAERPCVTGHLNIHGFHPASQKFGHCGCTAPTRGWCRSWSRASRSGPSRMDPALPYTAAEVIWAVRHEMALTVEDVLARRTRALFLNARAALRMAPRVADLMAGELGRDAAWKSRPAGGIF